MFPSPRIVATVAVAAASASAGISYGASASSESAHVGPERGDQVIVSGCPAEDDCRIDYRGGGHWVITRAREAR